MNCSRSSSLLPVSWGTSSISRFTFRQTVARLGLLGYRNWTKTFCYWIWRSLFAEPLRDHGGRLFSLFSGGTSNRMGLNAERCLFAETECRPTGWLRVWSIVFGARSGVNELWKRAIKFVLFNFGLNSFWILAAARLFVFHIFGGCGLSNDGNDGICIMNVNVDVWRLGKCLFYNSLYKEFVPHVRITHDYISISSANTITVKTIKLCSNSVKIFPCQKNFK